MMKVGRIAARRFLVQALLLERPAASVGDALAHLGYVQMDPINICGRMHDLILRNRVAGYRENALLEHLYRERDPERRVGFEHHLPGAGVLVALPLEAWPHLIDRTRERRNTISVHWGRLTAAESRLAERILGELAERGALTSDDIEHDARATTAWGSRARMVKTVLEKLFVHGRVFISRRENFRRVYDLPERVLPARLLSARAPDAEVTRRWILELRLRQRRLVRLKRDEAPLVEAIAAPVSVDGMAPVYCLRSDLPLLESCQQNGAASAAPADGSARAVRLLAPLDPLIYDRPLTRRLWEFDYTWEVYTPAAKRKRGYYALPVLSGTELVGHVDPKADRTRRRLAVVSRSVRRGHRVAGAVRELERFLGLKGP